MVKTLIVEDDEFSRKLLRRLIEKTFRFEVSEAENGVEGLSVLQSFVPDLIFLDIGMPVMNGVEFLEAIRTDPSLAHLPVIVLTSYSDKKTVGKMIELGIADYILKPLEREDAIERINRVLNLQKAVKQRSEQIERHLPSERERYLLLCDKDVEFKAFLLKLIGRKFDLLLGETGADCLELYLRHKPKMICLGEGLAIVNEVLVAKKIRSLDTAGEARLFLFVKDEASHLITPGLFDGILMKTSHSEELLRNVYTKVLGLETISEVVIEVIKELLNDFYAAIKHTFGVMTTDEIILLDQNVAIPADSWEYAKVLLREHEEKFQVTINICGSKKDLIAVSNKVQNASPSFQGTVYRDVFGELVNTLSGVIRHALERLGIVVYQRQLQFDLEPHQAEIEGNTMLIPFRMRSFEKLIAIIHVGETTF